MKGSHLARRLAAAVVLSLVAATVCDAAAPVDILIFIRSRAQPAGPALYDLQVFGGSTLQTATSPGGHVFSGFLSTLQGLTEAEALAQTIGQWTIERPPVVPPGQPAETHTFSVAPFSIGDFFATPPTITSPANNSVVPTSFQLEFAWPPGVTPPTNRSANWTVSSQIANADVHTSLSNSFPVDVTFRPGESTGTLQIAVGTSNDMASYLSEVTTTAANPYWDYSASMRFYNISSRLTVTVTSVPEPTSFALAAVVISLGVGTSSRR